MRVLLAATALLAPLLAMAAVHQAALAAAPNDIIWDPPKAPAASSAAAPSKETMVPVTPAPGAPDRNGIVWDTPGTPSSSASAPPAAAPPPGAKPDSNGIVWNAAPGRPSGAPSNASLAPPPPLSNSGPSNSGRLAQAPVTNGPCREFQTTIVIDGKNEPAHGTVCQQADGTWRVVNK